ncbi:hypothetical protein [Deinococcus yavapaiensis]|uniref:Uncharacterized protein n=1 Tax=Deinococcus yavapaiensis KR-236 TaxID=694435 RepID=A0A318SBQ1_9DEIO|nr:hypothetical protein [Deinococcus yavapaiensis]PYE56221.1 hypothetical protein DES52_10125 [Deinococcus yavapaiensis KR-236]
MADFRRIGRHQLLNVDLVVQLRVKKQGLAAWVPQAQLITGEWVDVAPPCDTAHAAEAHFQLFTSDVDIVPV